TLASASCAGTARVHLVAERITAPSLARRRNPDQFYPASPARGALERIPEEPMSMAIKDDLTGFCKRHRRRGPGAQNVSFVTLGDLELAYGKAGHAAARGQLRAYIIYSAAPTPWVYRSVSSTLFVDGAIDKPGLSDLWLAGATKSERAALFSRIATARLRTGPR